MCCGGGVMVVECVLRWWSVCDGSGVTINTTLHKKYNRGVGCMNYLWCNNVVTECL